jgi:hypothetical protein
VVEILMDTLCSEEVVLGGGNMKKLKELPLHRRAGENADTCVFGSHEHACRKRTHQR